MINLKKGNDVTAATADGAVNNTSKKEIIPSIPGVPKANLEVIAIVMFNAGIRRFTALNIISHLKEAGILKKDSKAYVNFIWTKFRVKENGLATEYRYSELFFIKALISAFTDFANASAENINEFCNNNDIDVSRLNDAADSADKDDSAK